jgi:hypothetical protein
MQEDSVIRVHHDESNPYFIMVRSSAQDSRLSFEARGVLTYLLSKPNDWQVSPADIQREGGIGREKCAGILKELEDLGYIVVDRNTKNPDGTFSGNRYTVYEKPYTVQPLTVKPTLHNTESIQNTENNILSRRSTATVGRRRDYSQLNVHEPKPSTPKEEQYEAAKQAVKGSAMMRFLCGIFGVNELEITKKTVELLATRNTVKENGTEWRYPAPISLYDENELYRKFVAERMNALMRISGMTFENAMKNLARYGAGDRSIEGNEKKMPGYHFWLKYNHNAIITTEPNAVVDYGAPDADD